MSVLESTKVFGCERELIKSCKKGDRAALEYLVHHYQDKIYNTILKICQNPQDSLELTQDTFVKVIENIKSFNYASSVYTWIYKIATNLTLNHCKRKVKIKWASLEAEKDFAEGAKNGLKNYLLSDEAEDPSQIAASKEIQTMVGKSLENLSDEHRAVLVLRDIDGLSYDDIAEVLEIELGTVKSRLSRAREALKDILESLI